MSEARRAIAIAMLALSACASNAAQRAPVVAPVLAPRGETVHVVGKGESVYAIAKKYGVSIEAIAVANHLSDPKKLDVGQRLVIPVAVAESGLVEPSSDKITARPLPEQVVEAPEKAELAVKESRRIRPAEPEPALARAPEAKTAWIWPVDGVVTSAFGNREGGKHDGIDIAAPLGTPVWASAAGKVLFAGEQPGYGRLVIVGHDGGWVSIYAHNAENLVKEGEQVSQGDPIARVGQSGEATTPALHFELRSGREVINPFAKLPE